MHNALRRDMSGCCLISRGLVRPVHEHEHVGIAVVGASSTTMSKLLHAKLVCDTAQRDSQRELCIHILNVLHLECRGKNPFLPEPIGSDEVGVLTLAGHSRLLVRSQPV